MLKQTQAVAPLFLSKSPIKNTGKQKEILPQPKVESRKELLNGARSIVSGVGRSSIIIDSMTRTNIFRENQVVNRDRIGTVKVKHKG